MPDESLRLVAGDETGPARGARSGVLSIAALLAVLALTATLLGADRFRRTDHSLELAERTLETSLDLGNTDPQVRANLLSLRRTVARRPLESRNRVAYASLLLGLSRSLSDTDAAAFHAEVAAGFAPVTVPVVRAAATVLVRARRLDEGLGWIHEMFRYDAGAATRLLLALEPLIPAERLEAAVPETAEAWLAWADGLRDSGRTDAAAERLRSGLERWPDHLRTRERAASRASALRDWEALARLVPPDFALPEDPGAARLWVWRARVRAQSGDAERARQDLQRAVALRPRHEVLAPAGDVALEIGDADLARRLWNRALFGLGPANARSRMWLHVRLARLEESSGHAAAALRQWREVLALDPGNAEAQRAQRRLTGAGG